jgi:multiple sugar transport system substrate-binding protein
LFNQKEVGLDEQVGSGNVPDLIFAGENEIFKLAALDVPQDLNALIGANKVDMSRFDPTLVSSIRKYSSKGETLALGYAMQYYATFYNKDIFDKFGVAYPKDGLTWSEQIEIAKKVTRTEAGASYYGMIAGGGGSLAQSLGLSRVDSKTKKAVFETEDWRKVFSLAQSIYGIPGNMPPKNKVSTAAKTFTQDKNVALLPWFGDTMINSLEVLLKAGTPMNWDMASYPIFPEHPGKSHEISFRSFIVSKTSKYKDDAFQVAKFLSTSDEAQSRVSQDGFGPALKDEKYQKMFGANVEVLKGKSVAAIFKTTPIEIHNITIYDPVANQKGLNPAYDAFIDNKIEANTALRQAQEEGDMAIAESGL